MEKLGFEAALDYLLEFIDVRGEQRANKADNLAGRGIDEPPVRYVDAPKPKIAGSNGASE